MEQTIEKKLFVADQVKLKEAAVSKNGTVQLCLITPGWGSSGYYSEALLKNDGVKVFTAGLHNYWDHPTITEEYTRPERSLRDLAGALVETAEWKDQGWNGPGLYAEGKVFKDYQEALDEMAEHIGVSVVVYGTMHVGEAEGETGDIIDSFVAARSADYVTLPGRGGNVKSMFESVGRGGDPHLIINDPKKEEDQHKETREEEHLDELQQLKEAKAESDSKLKTSEDAVASVTKERDEVKEENGQLKEAIAFRDAKDKTREALNKVEGMPEATKTRLTESIATDPPIKDGKLNEDALVQRINEKVKKEAEYLTSLGFGEVKDLGGGSPFSESEDIGNKESGEKVAGELEDSFKRMGLKESSAKIAAGGRN